MHNGELISPCSGRALEDWSGLTTRTHIVGPPPVDWGYCNWGRGKDLRAVRLLVTLQSESKYDKWGERTKPHDASSCGPSIVAVDEGSAILRLLWDCNGDHITLQYDMMGNIEYYAPSRPKAQCFPSTARHRTSSQGTLISFFQNFQRQNIAFIGE